MDDNELDRLFGNEPEDTASDTEAEKEKTPGKESSDESAEVKGFVVSQYEGPEEDSGEDEDGEEADEDAEPEEDGESEQEAEESGEDEEVSDEEESEDEEIEEFLRKKKTASISDQIKSLPPELKALLVSDVLKRKDDE